MFKTDAEIYYTIIAGGGLMILLIGIIIIAIIKYQNRILNHRKEQRELKSQFSQTLLQSQLEIQEQTLQHIGHELHDNIGQVASLIKINLNTLQLNDGVRAKEKIEDTKELIRQLITDIKSLSVSLGADRIAQTGLVKALETEAERLNKTGQFTAIFTQEGRLPELDNDKSVILYRMAQEILNNIVKHSGARQITISLTSTENLFTLAFTDDGIGFDLNQKKNSGAGLFNLQSRAQLINAKLIIQSIQGKGTLVIIELPV